MFTFFDLFWLLSHTSFISCRLLMPKSWSARRESDQAALLVSCLTICQMRMPCPPGGYIQLIVLDCGSGNKSTVKFETQVYLVAWWLWHPTPITEALVQFRREAKFILLMPWNWHIETMGRGITRLCASDVSWLLHNKGNWGCGNGGGGVCWRTVDGWWFFLTACVEICWRWIHWQRRVGCVGSQGSCLMARELYGSRMGYLP